MTSEYGLEVKMPVQKGVTNRQIIEPIQIPPDDSVLRDKIVNYVKENKRKSYLKMKRDNKLEDYISVTITMCKGTAVKLIDLGISKEEAWNRAIRQDILESESD
jgi:hypothetical protein